MGLALRAIGQRQAAGERDLVAAVRQGDDRAFEELFARYRSRITAYVLGMVRDHARAEDITQEVFLSALRRLRDTERPIAFKPWIYEIARNACIDEFRRTRRAAEVPLNGEDEAGVPERTLISRQPTPDAAMENKQRLVALRDAFRGLSENHHRLLVMRELEGLSYAQIAEQMGMSRPMVESSLFRARRRLGEEYEELASGRRCQQVCEVVDRTDAPALRVLGVRARRQVALHLSHCEDCRRYAHLAGADEALFRAPTFADKVAALFPFGWLGRRLGARFLARRLSGATHFIGSSAILGRVAAAVLVVAAAGGGYAGVTQGTASAGKTRAAEASAVIKPATGRASAASPSWWSGGGGAALASTGWHPRRPPSARRAGGEARPRDSGDARPAGIAREACRGQRLGHGPRNRAGLLRSGIAIEHELEQPRAAAPSPGQRRSPRREQDRLADRLDAQEDDRERRATEPAGQGAAAGRPAADSEGDPDPARAERRRRGQLGQADGSEHPRSLTSPCRRREAVGYWAHRGVAQPGSAHRSGR